MRTWEEIQGLGILDFAFRGSKMQVPAFNKNLSETDCGLRPVSCGLSDGSDQYQTRCRTGVKILADKIYVSWHRSRRQCCGSRR